MNKTSALFGTFRSQLTLTLGGLSLCILLSVGLYVGRVATRELFESQGESLRAMAKAAADLLGANLRERTQEIELLSRATQFTEGRPDLAAIQQSLEMRKEAHSEYAWLGFADSEGVVQKSTGGMLVGRSVAQREWFVVGSKQTYLGDVHEAKLLATLLPAKASSEPLRFIDFAAPVRAPDGSVKGVLGAHAHWNWVTETVSAAVHRQRARTDVEILIVDRGGKVLYPEQLETAQETLAAQQPGKPYARAHWGDGREYLTSVVRMPTQPHVDLGWRIVARQPMEVAMAPVIELRNRLIVLGGAALALIVLAAGQLARRMSRPLEKLAEVARQVESRHAWPEFPKDSTVREVSLLSEAMRSMTRSLLDKERELESLNASLETQVAERTADLQAANGELERLATRDALTDLYNRRSLDALLEKLYGLMRRYGRVYSMLVLDADHFKRVNDQFGHPTGDAVLKQLAEHIRSNIRGTDFAARSGGEEFVVLLPEAATSEAAWLVAEKIRLSVAEAEFAGVGRMTLSIGVGLADPGDATADTLMQRADAALYEAKRSGRNRVCVQSGPASTPIS